MVMESQETDSSSRDLQLAELLAAALDLPHDRQREFVEQSCDDPSLVEEALELLAFDAQSDTFLVEPAAQILDLTPPETQAGEAADAPKEIGPYTLIRRLGEGGMGEVYLAFQSEPVERYVALKLALRIEGNPGAQRRFNLERQVLGRLAHPNIAQLFEAGTTEQGRPYVVMELVDGPRLTHYCDLHHLSIDDRLRLFLDICRGTQHAHLNQILHRDLKPSNILVADVDGRPVAKIIDFGIARALDRPVDHTYATGDGLVGTPYYMSPEALEPTRYGELDSRTDVYSLGVVLYELITGVPPFRSSSRDLARLMREILDEDLRRPSDRLIGLDPTERYRLAARRDSDPEDHLETLRQDLDWIVLKAMSKDREQRYRSAAELGDDVERAVTHRPVRARPPSFTYRAGKWVRRHRFRAILASVALVGLLVAAGLTGVALWRAQEAEARSRLDAEISRHTLDFVLELFQSISPEEGGASKDGGAQELLAEGIRRVQESELPAPAKAQIMHTLGDVHQRLGLYPPARELLRESLLLREQTLGADAAETLESAEILGNLERRTGDLQAAEPLLLRVLQAAEQNPEQPLRLANALNSLGNLRWRQGSLEDAEALHRRALDLRLSHLEPDDEAVAISHNNLGTLLLTAGRLRQAEPHLRRAAQAFESRLGPRHPRLADALGNVALVRQRLNAYQEAEKVQRRSLQIQREARGEEHPATATAMHNLAGNLTVLGRYEEAESFYRRALELRILSLGEGHPEAVRSLIGLGRLHWRVGDYGPAEELLTRALELRKLNDSDLAVQRSRRYLAVVQRDSGRAEAARTTLQEVLELQLASLGPEHRDIAWNLHELGLAELRLGRRDAAEQVLRRAVRTHRSLATPSNTLLADTLFELGMLLRDQGRSEEAAPLLREALGLRRELLPESHPDRIRSENLAVSDRW